MVPELALPVTPSQALTAFLGVLILLANAAGGLVVGVAVVRGILAYLSELVRSPNGETPSESIRLSLGRSLALALEFQVAADILGTALNPSLQDIGLLAAIVVLRTGLNFFLGRELSDADARRRQTLSPAIAAERPATTHVASLPVDHAPSTHA